MKIDEMAFFERINGLCPICRKDIVIAASDYWGCSGAHFFVHLNGQDITRIDMYPCTSDGMFGIVFNLDKDTITVKVPSKSDGITLPIQSETFMYSLINKIIDKLDVIMLLKP